MKAKEVAVLTGSPHQVPEKASQSTKAPIATDGGYRSRPAAYDPPMETWDAITSRRNVREFSDQAVSPADLDRILEAGRLTPSARNWQPWDFILVTDPARLSELTGVWRGAWHLAGAKAAIAVISVGGEQELPVLNFDLGQAVMQMILAAADLGLGTGHASVHDQDLARRILGFPTDRYCAHLISVGYPADRPLRPVKKMNRKPFDEVVHRETW